MADEEYEVRVTGDVSSYTQSIDQATTSTNALNTAIVNAGASLKNLYDRGQRGLTIIASGQVAGITAVTLAAARLDQQMSQLQAHSIMVDKSFKTYDGTVSRLRQNFGLAAGDAISLVTQLNKLGQQPQHMEKMVSSYVKLSAVTGESVNSLAAGQTQFMRQMGAAAPAVNKYSSMFAKLSSDMGTSAQGTIDFASQIAPLSKTMGMSATQIAGVSAAFTAAGQDGFAAANAYTKILTDVNRAIRYGGPELDVYARLVGKTNDQFKEMPTAEKITTIFEAIQKQGPQGIKTLEAIGLEGIRTQKALAGVGAGGGLRKAMGIAESGFNDQSKFDEASTKALSGFMDSMGKIGETFKTFGQQVGTVFLPAANAMAGAVNTMLGPLRALGDVFSSLSDGKRNLVAVAAALGVLGTVALKFIPALYSLGLVGQATRGPLAMGLRAGFNPGGREMDAQRTFRQGGGNAVQRLLFQAGLLGGDLMNTRGQRGNLADRGPWMRPNAAGGLDQYDRQSSGAARVAWMKQQGFVGQDYDPAKDHRGRNALSRAAIGTMGFVGSAARMGLTPLQPGYMMNSMGYNPDAMTQQSTMRGAAQSAFARMGFAGPGAPGMPTGTGAVPLPQPAPAEPASRLRTLVSREGFDANREEMTKRWGSVKDAFKSGGKEVANATEEHKKQTSVLRAARSEMGKLAVATTKAGAGLGMGLGMGAAKGLWGAGTAVASSIGPAGLAIGGAMGVGALGIAAYDARKQAATRDEGIREIGADYKDALGLASSATLSFADMIAENSKKIAPAAKDMSEALTVTNANIEAVSSQVRQISDKNIESLKASDVGTAKTYAGQMLAQGVTTPEAEALKYDLMTKFGAPVAQDILNSAQKDQGNLFGLMRQQSEGDKPWYLRESVSGGVGNLFTDSQLKQRGDMVTSTMIEQQNKAGESRGTKGMGQTRQAQANQYFLDVMNRAKANPQGFGGEYNIGASTGDQESRQEFTSLMQGMGLDPDEVNRGATQKALKELQDWQKKNPNAGVEEQQAAVQRAITGNYAGTSFGAATATNRQQAGGVFAGTTVGRIGQPGVNPLDQYGGFQNSPGFYGTKGGQMAMDLGPQGFGSSLTKALESPEETGLVGAAMDEMVLKMRGTTGSWTQAEIELNKMADSAQGATNGLDQITAAAAKTARAEGEYDAQFQGQGTLVERMGVQKQRFDAAEEAFRADPKNDEARKRYEAERQGVRGLAMEELERTRAQAMQFRALDFQRQQGLESMNRSQGIQLRMFNQQQAFAEEDYNTQRSRNLRNFNLQRERAEDSFYRNRARQERNFQLQQSRAISDFNLNRKRAEEDFERSLDRGERDRGIQLKRQREDFNRQRQREEENHQTQIVRMTRDTAKSVYDIYSRVNVQRTADAENLLMNLADQEARLIEQNANLKKIREMGLSNEAITMLGLEQAGNAQQLQRLVQDFGEDPRLIAEFNSRTVSRTKESGKLMKDASNTSYQDMEKDRKKNLKQQREDYQRGVDQSAQDYHRSINDAREDFARNQRRSERDFEKSLKRSNKDYRLATKEQNEDFLRGMKESKKDFTLQMSESYTDFNKLKERQRLLMIQGWEQMREDFDYQMEQQVESINKYAEDISLSFDEAREIVEAKSSKEIKAQIKSMNTLMDGYKTEVVGAVHDIDTEVKKPYDQWGVKPKAKPSPGDRGPKQRIPGGPDDDSSGNPSRQDSGPGSGGDETGWPTSVHHVGTPWGKRGDWRGSRTLGPGYHSGADITAPHGAQIRAAADGTVGSVRNDGAYGNLTVLNHGNGVQTWYAHQSRTDVKRGDQVSKGDRIGAVGQTGRAFGSHLHLELVVNGKDKDPIPWIKGTDSGGNFNTSPGNGGGDRPDFASMKSIKNYEKLLARLGYDPSTRKLYHSTMGYKAGDLAAAIQKDFDEKTAEQFDNTGPGGAPGSPDTGGKKGARGVWNALRTGGLTEKQAAGVMGNMWSESNMIWNIVQGGGRSNNPNRSNGYGLVQWTPGTKLGDILEKGNKKNNLENQIWALFQQLNGKAPHSESEAGRDLRNQDTVFGATKSFLRKYERAQFTGDDVVNTRNKKSLEYYKSFSGDSLPGDNPGGAKGARMQKALDYANKHEGHQYQFGTMWDCSGFMSQLQNIITTGSTGGRRYSTPDFGGSSAEGFDRNAKSGFMIGVNTSSGRQGHMAGHLLGHAVESSGSAGVRVDSGSKGKDQSIFHWFGGLRGYASGTQGAKPGWHWVGENGPELRSFQGGETVLSAAQSAVAAAKAQQTVTAQNSVYQTNIDNSANYTGEISVYAADLKDFQAQLEAQARLAALTKPPKSKAAA